MDGFIRLSGIDDGQTSKVFFVTGSGITASCMLASQDTYAIAGMNNNVYLFSFFTGTTLKEFDAHDDFITSILYKN